MLKHENPIKTDHNGGMYADGGVGGGGEGADLHVRWIYNNEMAPMGGVYPTPARSRKFRRSNHELVSKKTTDKSYCTTEVR